MSVVSRNDFSSAEGSARQSYQNHSSDVLPSQLDLRGEGREPTTPNDVLSIMIIFFLLFSQPVFVLGLFVFGALSFLRDLNQMHLFVGENGTDLTNKAREAGAGQHFRQVQPQTLEKARRTTSLILGASSDGFDYASFWEEAWNIAVANNATLTKAEKQQSSHPSETKPCPKVYIYDTSFSTAKRAKDKDKVFGSKNESINPYHRGTNMFSLALILEYRLRKSKECFTKNPDEADLFYVPMHTKPKKTGEWTETCLSKKRHDVPKLLKELPHLSNATACRHFFVVSKGHYVGRPCEGSWFRPVRELQNTQRIAYSHLDFICDKLIGGPTTSHIRADEKTPVDYPHLMSVPYPSSIHYTSKLDAKKHPLPWEQSSNRDTLMLFLGSTIHGDTDVRKRIAKQCRSYEDDSICVDSTKTGKTAVSGADVTLSTKGRSIFCLEPAGDSPYRKSLSDSITYGCIPVLFSDLTDEVAPWHWRKWKDQGRVLVPRKAYAKGKIDLKTLLESAPPKLVQLMQETISRYARDFQYSLEDDNDGIRIMLDGLDSAAGSMERQGLCATE